MSASQRDMFLTDGFEMPCRVKLQNIKKSLKLFRMSQILTILHDFYCALSAEGSEAKRTNRSAAGCDKACPQGTRTTERSRAESHDFIIINNLYRVFFIVFALQNLEDTIMSFLGFLVIENTFLHLLNIL